MTRPCPPLLFALLLAGCATTSAHTVRTNSDGWTELSVDKGSRKQEILWRSGSPGARWRDDGTRTTDFGWVHSTAPAVIYGDSSCGRRVEDVPLTVLVNHLTFGFEAVTTESQESLDLAGRGALRRVFTATLDGRPVKLASTVVKKGPCVFDLVYLHADPARFANHLPEYEAVVAGLAIKEGP